ncbi:hypothetical protein C0Q70_12412 [Pomacea canaliculata]|uniref:Uncharacterized protein n=1 Tax=Pomacea canaliculata TaxID=400727 RepID=A0A2T7P1F3_POMCA|nr:hypothetical protein C0Q70_12412 [Pomacea canaliculata]
MTSFRSNRFNCVFEADAAIIHHKDHLKGLLGSETPGHTNKFLTTNLNSVHADCSDNNLLCLVCAIALLYFGLTGPFWALVDSKITDTGLLLYEQSKEHSVEKWGEDTSDLLDLYFSGVFHNFREMLYSHLPLQTTKMSSQ